MTASNHPALVASGPATYVFKDSPTWETSYSDSEFYPHFYWVEIWSLDSGIVGRELRPGRAFDAAPVGSIRIS